MLTICGIRNCNTMKKAFSWLDENKVDYQFRDFKKDPLSINELTSLIKRVGIETLVNKKGMTWKKLGLAGKNLTDQELIGQLLKHQTMIKRPVLIDADDHVLVGFDDESFSQFTAGESLQ